MNGWGKYLLHIEHDIWNYNPLLCSKHRTIHLMDYYSTWHYSASFPSSLAKYWKLSEKACQIHRRSWPGGCALIRLLKAEVTPSPPCCKVQRKAKGDRQYKQWPRVERQTQDRWRRGSLRLSLSFSSIKGSLFPILWEEEKVPHSFQGAQKYFLTCSKVEFDLLKNDLRMTFAWFHSSLSATCWMLDLEGIWETLLV